MNKNVLQESVLQAHRPIREKRTKTRRSLTSYMKGWLVSIDGVGWERWHLSKSDRKGKTWQEIQSLRKRRYKAHQKMVAKRA